MILQTQKSWEVYFQNVIRNFDSSSLKIKETNLFPDISLNGTIYYNSNKFEKDLLINNNIFNWDKIDVIKN